MDFLKLKESATEFAKTHASKFEFMDSKHGTSLKLFVDNSPIGFNLHIYKNNLFKLEPQDEYTIIVNPWVRDNKDAPEQLKLTREALKRWRKAIVILYDDIEYDYNPKSKSNIQKQTLQNLWNFFEKMKNEI